MLNKTLSTRQCELVITLLQDVLRNGATLDRAYARAFADLQLSPAEHAIIALVTGDLLRRLNLYCTLAGVEVDRAAASGWSLLCVWHRFHNLPMPDCAAANQIDTRTYEARKQQARALPAVWDGCPAWLDALGETQLGEEAWAAERAALARTPKRYLRVNTLRCDRDTLIQRLADEGVQARPVDGVASALEVLNDAALFRTAAFQDGWFEQQDAGSQHIAAFLQVSPGMRVVDACAGAGGKTLQLAAAMNGKGRLLAMDVEEWKLENLRQRARRAGAHNVEARLITSSKTVKRLKETADRLLLDVPCSGLGVLKRNPDAKWRDTEQRLPVLMALQADILRRYCQMVKPGGQLVYATCSILPCENEQQVAAFLAERPDFTLVAEQHVLPSQTGFDGFYMARLRRAAIDDGQTAPEDTVAEQTTDNSTEHAESNEA